jgi:hypothetical protein
MAGRWKSGGFPRSFCPPGRGRRSAASLPKQSFVNYLILPDSGCELDTDGVILFQAMEFAFPPPGGKTA